MHAVVRDGLGGIGYLTREFDVLGEPAPEEDKVRRACDCRTDPHGLPLPIPLALLVLLVWRLRRRR